MNVWLKSVTFPQQDTLNTLNSLSWNSWRFTVFLNDLSALMLKPAVKIKQTESHTAAELTCGHLWTGLSPWRLRPDSQTRTWSVGSLQATEDQTECGHKAETAAAASVRDASVTSDVI